MLHARDPKNYKDDNHKPELALAVCHQTPSKICTLASLGMSLPAVLILRNGDPKRAKNRPRVQGFMLSRSPTTAVPETRAPRFNARITADDTRDDAATTADANDDDGTPRRARQVQAARQAEGRGRAERSTDKPKRPADVAVRAQSRARSSTCC